jgi:hypothetical protein
VLIGGDEFGGQRGDPAAVSDRIELASPDECSELHFYSRRGSRVRTLGTGMSESGHDRTNDWYRHEGSPDLELPSRYVR